MWQRNLLAGSLLLALLMITVPCIAVDEVQGEIRVSGVVLESTCQLSMASADQTVMLGHIGSGELTRSGMRGAPVEVPLTLYGCVSSPGDLRDASGNLLWSAAQPAISVRFWGVADRQNPQLFDLRGVEGVGLRLLDPRGLPLPLGEVSRPRLLMPGTNQLVYYVAAERTSGVIRGGAYSALLQMGVSYD